MRRVNPSGNPLPPATPRFTAAGHHLHAAAAIADEWDGIWHRPASLRCDYHLAAADRLKEDW